MTVLSPNDTAQNRRTGLILVIFLLFISLVGFVIRLPEIWDRMIDPDEFEHLHAAFSMSAGMVPYRDFFEHHPPLFWLVLLPLFRLFDDPASILIGARVLMAVMTLGTLIITFDLAKTLSGKLAGILSVAFLVHIGLFLEKSFETRPDVPELLFWLLSIRIVVAACRRNRSIFFGVAGFLAGFSILCSQKAIPGIVGLLAGIMLHPWLDTTSNRRGIGFHHALFFLLGCVLPLGAVYCVFILLNGGNEFIYRCFLFNAVWKVRLNPIPVCLEFIRQNPVIFSLGLTGFFMDLGFPRTRYERTAFLGALVGFFFGIGLIPVVQRQYLLLLFPLWSIFGAEWLAFRVMQNKNGDYRVWDFVLAISLGISLAYSSPTIYGRFGIFILLWFVIFALAFLLFSCRSKFKNSVLKEVLLAMIVVGILLPPLIRSAQRDYIRNTMQLEHVRIVMEETQPTDAVFDGWSGYGFFRPHAYYYFFLHREIRAMLKENELGNDVVESLRKTVPKIVIYDNQIQRLAPEVSNYIYDHYRPMGIGDFYRRID
ncbi:MAG: glycosyltransferase family 39 protein [bacterium]